MSKDSHREPYQDGGPSPLEELLACEQELTERLARAQAEARRLVDVARAEVARAQAEMEASLEADSLRVRAQIRAETQASVREISVRARERIEGYECVAQERVARLADDAFRRLVGAEGER